MSIRLGMDLAKMARRPDKMSVRSEWCPPIYTLAAHATYRRCCMVSVQLTYLCLCEWPVSGCMPHVWSLNQVWFVRKNIRCHNQVLLFNSLSSELYFGSKACHFCLWDGAIGEGVAYALLLLFIFSFIFLTAKQMSPSDGSRGYAVTRNYNCIYTCSSSAEHSTIGARMQEVFGIATANLI